MSNVLDQYQNLVGSINTEYSNLHNISNDELRQKLCQIEKAINDYEDKRKSLDDYLIPVFAIVKETARRFSEGNIMVSANSNDVKLADMYDFVEIMGDKAIYKNHWDVMGVPNIWNMVHYDEQLLGGILLHYGFATEMATGEGKTLVATLPVFLNALTHDGVHLMTVNDYLSKRDFEATRPIYMFHGLSADCIDYYTRHDFRRKNAYNADISFGENSSFTFDYLFDHLALAPEECVQTQKHNFAIIDELDSILIDDADEPHIIGGGNYYMNDKIYKENYPIVNELIEQKNSSLYQFDKLKKKAFFTDEGKNWLRDKKGIPDLYAVERTYEIDGFDGMPQTKQNEIRETLYLQNVLNQLLLALVVYERDVDYLVEGGKVKIIDPHTGRVKESSRWEYGLHTAMEVKENVQVQWDFDGMAIISLKNYFKLYNKIAGMSGTIMPVEDELKEIYDLKCASLPTHKPMIRQDAPLRIFKTAEAKDNAIIKTILDNRKQGRPTLVGSLSIKRSEKICVLLDEFDIMYNKLDAKTTKNEAETVAKAGINDTITVSTSVAGRGTDIKPSQDAIRNGGLMVVGTDLFDSVRVDRQLKGRSGRQGNPGSSVFFASLEDQILQNLESNDLIELQKIAAKIPDQEISVEEVRQYFIKAQSNREVYFKNCRKETARKDDVVAPQRRKFYEQRNSVLFNADDADVIVDDIVKKSNSSMADIEKNLKILYDKTKQLVVRSTRNNADRSRVRLPFSYNLKPFSIYLDVNSTIGSYEYFKKEYKRQVILSVYDQEWKSFVLYMMGNLDSKEIDMLDGKYNEMIKETNAIILSYLQFATIPVGGYESDISQFGDDDKADSQSGCVSPKILPDDNCPCGSGKKYCECHGGATRRPRRRR